jgi:hypothetical protein
MSWLLLLLLLLLATVLPWTNPLCKPTHCQ